MTAALARGVVRDLFVTEAAAGRFADLLREAGTAVHRVTERAATALSDTVTPAGLVAVCDVVPFDLSDLLARGPRLVVVAVDLAEPGNAGTLIRLADAFGAAAVVLAGHCVDQYNAKCLRASAGSVFTVPVVEVADAVAAIGEIATAGLQVLATDVNAELTLDEAGRLLSAPTAWVFGSEAHGLSAEVASSASQRVRIPMHGGAESLNVAAAAAICLYQTSRAHA